MRAIIVAGTCSGAGTSSIALGIMAAYTRRGLRVQPFKIGPDFVDPMHHRAATGQECFNLDSWMMSRDVNLACFMRCAATADVAIVEGVMGIYDGRDGKSEAGSTAEMAKFLNASVLLVIDTRGLARSAAALIRGYTSFDPEVSFAGIMFNKIGSSTHRAWLSEAVSNVDQSLRVLGGIPEVGDLHLPDEMFHSNLAADEAAPASYLKSFADLVEHYVDLDGLLDAAGVWKPNYTPSMRLDSPPPYCKHVRIGVARDAAFCRYYHENLSLLQDSGAELVFFSPLRDSLPTRLDAIIFGGGYPEHHLEVLSLNKEMLYAVRAFADAGGIIYAEAGGVMYLSQGIETQEHQSFSMCGVFPFWTRTQAGTSSGYVKVIPQDNCVLFPPDIGEIRGHLYKCSEVFWRQKDGINLCPRGFLLKHEGSEMEELEGYMQGNAMATFVRLHFGSNPVVVHNLIERCRNDSSKAAAVAAASASAVAHAGPQAAAAAGSAAARAVTAALGDSRGLVPYSGDRKKDRKSHAMLDPARRTRSLSTSPVYKNNDLPDSGDADVDADIKETTEDASNRRMVRSHSEIWDFKPQRPETELSAPDTEICVDVTSTSSPRRSLFEEQGGTEGTEETVVQVAERQSFLSRRMERSHFSGCHESVPDKRVLPQKVVSLLPLATEIVMKLGAGNRLLGLTDTCDKPSGVRMGRHIVCRNLQKFGTEREALFKLDLPWLSKVKPDLIITQQVCSLCSIDSKTVAEAISRAGIQDTVLFVVNPHTLSDVWAFIMELADILGVHREACVLVNALRSRLRRVAASVAAQHPRRVLLLQGLDPLTLGGRWIAEIEMLANAYDGLQKPGCSSERLHWQRITSYAPEFIILAPCFTSVEQTLSEVHKLARQPGFWSVPAVEARQIYICEGSYFGQAGLRIVEGMELLAHILHPNAILAPSSTTSAGVLKLSLKQGQKCRPEELHRHFKPII